MRENGRKMGALTRDECISRAQRYISEAGMCLLIMDIVHSRSYPQRDSKHNPISRLMELAEELNSRFADHLPENSLTVGESRIDRGFQVQLGDAMWGAIDSAAIIPEIFALIDDRYADLELHYGVARDGWDEGMVLVR